MTIERKPFKPSAPLQILGYLAVIIYLGIGLYLLIKPGVLDAYSPTVQTTLGVVLLLYGIFRLYMLRQRNRWLKKQQEKLHEDE